MDSSIKVQNQHFPATETLNAPLLSLQIQDPGLQIGLGGVVNIIKYWWVLFTKVNEFLI